MPPLQKDCAEFSLTPIIQFKGYVFVCLYDSLDAMTKCFAQAIQCEPKQETQVFHT